MESDGVMRNRSGLGRGQGRIALQQNNDVYAVNTIYAVDTVSTACTLHTAYRSRNVPHLPPEGEEGYPRALNPIH
jgi:hypothetical protein